MKLGSIRDHFQATQKEGVVICFLSSYSLHQTQDKQSVYILLVGTVIWEERRAGMCPVPKVKDGIFLLWKNLTTTRFYYRWQTLDQDTGEGRGATWATLEMGRPILICVSFLKANHFRCSKTGKEQKECQQRQLPVMQGKCAQIIRMGSLTACFCSFCGAHMKRDYFPKQGNVKVKV